MFVIWNNDKEAFVAWPGAQHSFTGLLQRARLFATREQAERDACGNETVMPLGGILPMEYVASCAAQTPIEEFIE